MSSEETDACPQCGGPIAPLAERCPRCGAEFAYGDEPAALHPMDRRDFEPHRGNVILALGIFTILLPIPTLCCHVFATPLILVGYGLGITALVMARRDLRLMREHVMDWRGRSATQSGRVCAIVGIIINSLFLLGLLAVVVWLGLNQLRPGM
jgi:hypothetical protein